MNHDASRRDFLRLSAPLLLGALGISLSACDDSNPAADDGTSGISISGNRLDIDLTRSDTSALAAAGGFLFVRAAHALVVNTDGSQFRAFTSICTHQGCDVDRFQERAFVCRCHGSRFNTSGQVINGPAEAPLREFPVSRSGSLVSVTLA